MTELEELRRNHERLAASVAVLEQLAFALFDACPDKLRAIKQFAATTERTIVENLYSGRSETFYDECEIVSKVYLQLLAEAT